MMSDPSIQNFGEHAILISWKDRIDVTIYKQVLHYNSFVLNAFGKEILETVFTYNSLAVFLNETVNIDDFIRNLNETEFSIVDHQSALKYVYTIPVCYDIEFGPDLNELAHQHDLSVSEVVKLHARIDYQVFFIGFLPGFPYLGELDTRLHTPRKKTPRHYVKKGSVGIAGGQTGIYTMDSPGGWNIIGRTPIILFEKEADPPCFLKAEDYIRFVPISKNEFLELERLVGNNTYKIGKEVYDG